ncbi:MAG: hypothetical protein V3R91_01385 [Myxococcota bacterium]
MLAKRFARDALIVAAGWVVWRAVDSWSVQSGGLAATATAIPVAIVLSVVWGYLAHEWGHLAGAKISGGGVRVHGLRSFPVFTFDTQGSSRTQFQVMGWGGNLAPWCVLALLLALVPSDAPARIALIAAVVGGTLFTNLVEVPVLLRVARGGTIDVRQPGSRYLVNALTALAVTLLVAFVL